MNPVLPDFLLENDIINFLYPLLHQVINGNQQVPGYTQNIYHSLIEQLDYRSSATFLENLIIVFELSKDRISDFAHINSLTYDHIKSWLEFPKPDNRIILIIKRLLYTGVFNNRITTYQTDDFLIANQGNLSKFKDDRKIRDVILVDGDNVYVHGAPLYTLNLDTLYVITFFRRNTISPYISANSMATNLITDFIESYDIQKDASDVSLNTVFTILKYRYVSENVSPKNFHILTGDHYANEVWLSGVNFLAAFENVSSNSHVSWLDSQVIDYSDVEGTVMTKDNWVYDYNDFPIYSFGPLLFPRLWGDGILADTLDVNKHRAGAIDYLKIDQDNINNLLSIKLNLQFFRETYSKLIGNNLNVKYPIASSYLIRFLKGTFNRQYQVLNFIDVNGINGYPDLKRLLNILPLPEGYSKFDMLDEYLFVMGSKLLPFRLVISGYYQKQVRVLNSLRQRHGSRMNPKPYDNQETITGILRITPQDPEFLVLLEIPQGYEHLAYVYKHVIYQEIFYKYLDIDMALGIAGVGTQLIDSSRRNDPGNIQITYFDVFY